MNKKSRYIIILVALVALGIYFLMRSNKKYMMSEGIVWTTEYHITYEGNIDLSDSITAVFNKVEKSANVYNSESLVSQFNAKGKINADSILMKIMAEAVAVNKQSKGLYDPTVMPLVKAYKTVRDEKKSLSKESLDSLLVLVGLDKVKVENGVLQTDVPGVQLDFSSIAKGLACDEVGRMLERNGVENYLVEIGGEVVAHGVNDRGEPWHISVDLPTDQENGTEHSSAMLITLNSESVATSGNYRKFAVVDGKRVTHIINPLTGEASQSDLLSVSIVAPHCVTADAWATACMVMGTKATQEMMEKRNDLGVMTISADSDGNYIVWSNKAFADKVTK